MTMTHVTPDGRLAVRDDWTELVTEGIEAAGRMDRDRWYLGELATRIVRRYGDDSFGKYAAAINVPARRLYEYRQVYAFYNGNCAYAQNLSWSHHRAAIRLADDRDTPDAADLDRAFRALVKAADRDWIVERFDYFIARWRRMFRGVALPTAGGGSLSTPGLQASVADFTAYAARRGGELVLKADALPTVADGARYRVVLFEAEV